MKAKSILVGIMAVTLFSACEKESYCSSITNESIAIDYGQ